jgi:sulfur carrier protein ThiS adenylyltransferase
MRLSVDKHDRGALTARNAPGIDERLKRGRVAVAGLGGLGSNIAVMLARIGVGKLLLVDFDRVEPGNLNRQHYDHGHLGMYKTDALKGQIEKINPFVETETRRETVGEGNVRKLFQGYPIVCEAFDNPRSKALLVNALLEEGGYKIVAGSGMAGYGSANAISTKNAFRNLYVCGDGEGEAKEGGDDSGEGVAAEGLGFMAPRVMVCAGHQANMALRLLLGIEKE